MIDIRNYIGTYIYCIKEIYNLTLYQSYKLVDVGELSNMHNSNKTGYGFCVLQEFYEDNRYKNTFHFFIEEEFQYYFADHSNYLKIKNRDSKLRKLGIK